MGCGASVPVADTRSRRRPWFSFMTKSSYEVRSCRPGAAHPRRARTPTARARADAQADRSLVTPPNSNVPTSEAMPTAPHGLQVLTGSGDCSALRILAPSCKQPEAGVAETPVGKLADDYKFFCPLCMMFYKQILEARRRSVAPPHRTRAARAPASARDGAPAQTPCCKQHICPFCVAEYVQTKTPEGRRVQIVSGRGLAIPAGIECAHCNVPSAGAQLRLLEKKEEVRPAAPGPWPPTPCQLGAARAAARARRPRARAAV